MKLEFNPLRAVTADDCELPWGARWRARLEGWGRRLHRGQIVNREHLLGRWGEELAYWFLRRRGVTIVARNYRLPRQKGEIDLIGWQEGVLVFVEVKSRARREEDFSALRAVDQDKRRILVRLARAYRWRKGWQGSFRFDAVAVYQPLSRRPEIEWHRDAFWAE